MYIDDLLIIRENQEKINQLKQVLTTWFKIIDLKPVIHYLRLYIVRNLEVDIILFIQETYIFKILERFGIKDARKIDTPIARKNIFIHSNSSYYVNLSTLIWYQ